MEGFLALRVGLFQMTNFKNSYSDFRRCISSWASSKAMARMMKSMLFRCPDSVQVKKKEKTHKTCWGKPRECVPLFGSQGCRGGVAQVCRRLSMFCVFQFTAATRATRSNGMAHTMVPNGPLLGAQRRPYTPVRSLLNLFIKRITLLFFKIDVFFLILLESGKY